MVRSGTTTKSKVVALAASVALAAGSIVATASTATAAPGDTTQFPVGQQPVDIVVGPDGNFWTVDRAANAVSRTTPDGQVTSFLVPGVEPNSIVVGPDNALWFTYFGTDAIGRITTDGATQNFPTGLNTGRATDIEVGSDGNFWITFLGANAIGKMTTSGDLETYPATTPREITQGPTGSNRMYYSAGPNGLGEVYLDGNVNPLTPPQGATFVGPIQLIDTSIWLGATTAQGSKLYRVGNDSYIQVNSPSIGSVEGINPGSDSTMWISDKTNNQVHHVTNSGNVAATFGTSQTPNAVAEGTDGNIWVAVGAFNTPGFVDRILTGQVPVSTAAPTVDYPAAAIEPPQPPTAGVPLTATNGSWDYRPTSYAYQWQVCATSEATSCTDVPGATGQNYTVATTDFGKYIRAGVTASNLNGASQPAYSGLVATGAAPAPAPAPAPLPATGEIADVGNGVVMVLDAPNRQKRKQRKTYDVVFSATDVQGTVTFEFRKNRKKKSDRVQTRTVVIDDGVAEVRWRVPAKWPRKGRTTVTATFIPAAGSPYQAAETLDRVRIRK